MRVNLKELVKKVKAVAGNSPVAIFTIGIDLKELKPYLDSFTVVHPQEEKLKQTLGGILLRGKIQGSNHGGILILKGGKKLEREDLEKIVSGLEIEEIKTFLENNADIVFSV